MISNRDKGFVCSPIHTSCGAHTVFYSPEVKVTAHLDLVSRLGMVGAVPPLSRVS